ncbi:phage terminase large subunit [Hymenobacter fodinae]|uniref:Phage terminase large subunit N-terminal domain-containing protein n=1 Tax=Hymenobacter fodinae TaxID=2510796 RepID=A0A4Z0P9X8_9BACT|nr:phage terminase large subunit [Hymenobacter fodinae]TGE08267.1 hypothetical protein EU556_11130 [Hymenobacter fodinae]
MKLTRKQTKALDVIESSTNDVSEILFGGGAGGGKSAIGTYWVGKSALKYPGSRWFLAREELKLLKTSTLQTFFDVMKLQGVRSRFSYKEQAGRIDVSNGSTIYLQGLPWVPSDKDYDYLGSIEYSGGFVDEIPQIRQKAWQVMKSRIRYKLDEFKLKPKIVGSCNPSKGWVYSYFYQKQREGKLEAHKAFIQSLYSDNPHIDSSYMKTLLELDPESRDRLMNGNWEYDNDPAALMTFDAISDTFSNSFVLPGARYISADIARKGVDKTTIWVWTGWRLLALVVLEKQLTHVVAAKIRELAAAHMVPMSHVVIDEDGVGGGVLDQLPGAKGFINNSRALPNPTPAPGTPYDELKRPENFASLKDQMSYYAARKVMQGEVYLGGAGLSSEQREQFSKEAEQVKSLNPDSDAKQRVVTKDMMKAALGCSPDYWDGFMMRSYFDYQPASSGFAFS